MKKLLTLVIAGVAVKYFLDSEKGQSLKTQLKGWLGEAQDAMKETVNRASGNVNQVADRIN
jgi:hypothetical protein